MPDVRKPSRQYHPNCTVFLRLRLDEGRRVGGFPAPENVEKQQGGKPSAAANTAVGNQQAIRQGGPAGRRAVTQAKLDLSARRGALSSGAIAEISNQIDQNAIEGRGAQSGLPNGVTTGRRPERTIDLRVTPLEVTIERPDVKSAAKASVVLDYRTLPIDPRALRSCSVRIALDDIGAESWADGVGTDLPRRADGQGYDVSGLNAPLLSELDNGSPVRFWGYADTWEIELDADSQKISLECRDLSAVLRDTRLPRGKQIDLKKPISEGVRELLDHFPAIRGGFPIVVGPATPKSPMELQDIYSAGGGTELGPVPFDSLQMLQRSKRGKKGKKGKKSRAKSSRKGGDQSVWDAIADVCLKLGLSPVVRQRILYLQEPQAQYRQAEPYVVVYGESLSALKFAKKYEGVSNQTIEVRSPDPTIGRTRWARYPVLGGEPTSGILGDPGSPQPKASRDSHVTPSGTPTEKVTVLQVAGISDLSTLEKIAQQTFEQISRQEIQGSFASKDAEARRLRPSANSTRFSAGSLLEIYPGDSVLTLVSPAQEVSSLLLPEKLQVLNDFVKLTQDDIANRARRLTQLGVSGKSAQQIAAAMQNIGNANKFQVHGTSTRWSHATGWEFTVGFQNFVTLRDEPAAELVAQEQETVRAGRVLL